MDDIVGNKYLSGMVALLLVLYAVFIAPALPNTVLSFFDTAFGKLLFIFLAAYVASEGDIQVSVMIAVALFVTLHFVNREKVKEHFYEGFADKDSDSHTPGKPKLYNKGGKATANNDDSDSDIDSDSDSDSDDDSDHDSDTDEPRGIMDPSPDDSTLHGSPLNKGKHNKKRGVHKHHQKKPSGTHSEEVGSEHHLNHTNMDGDSDADSSDHDSDHSDSSDQEHHHESFTDYTSPTAPPTATLAGGQTPNPTPGTSSGDQFEDVDRDNEYQEPFTNYSDPASGANLLNKHGISYHAPVRF